MSGPVVQGIDTLTSAMTSNIIPDREYLLQGSILDNHVEVLTHRLRGLCNNVGAGKDEGEKHVDNLGAPGERHHAVHHRRDPHKQGDGDLPKTKLAQLLEACIVVHHLRHKLWK